MSIKNLLTTEVQTLIQTNQVFEDHITEIESLITMRNTGELSTSEFDELVGDILDLDRINELAEGIEFDAKLAKILSAVLSIIPMVPK